MSYLHLGRGAVVDTADVVGIFDLDITSQSHLTRKYLAAAEKAGQVEAAAAEELPKSFVVCERDGKRLLVLSQMAAATLRRRVESGDV